MVSPTITTATVTMAVASQVYCSPKVLIAITEAREDRAIFTKLLPIKIALSTSSKCSISFSARAAPRLPLSARLARRMRLAEDRAISAPEKKAESIRQAKLATM